MSPQEYLIWRFQFGQVWHQDPRFMSLLGSRDQWRLHDFFQFHRQKDQVEALSWLFTVRACDQSVETNAMAAFQKLQLRLYELEQQSHQLSLPFKYGSRKAGRIVVSGIVNPEPDYESLASALLDLAREQIQKIRRRNEDL
jgi:hypothetical protein